MTNNIDTCTHGAFSNVRIPMVTRHLYANDRFWVQLDDDTLTWNVYDAQADVRMNDLDFEEVVAVLHEAIAGDREFWYVFGAHGASLPDLTSGPFDTFEEADEEARHVSTDYFGDDTVCLGIGKGRYLLGRPESDHQTFVVSVEKVDVSDVSPHEIDGYDQYELEFDVRTMVREMREAREEAKRQQELERTVSIAQSEMLIDEVLKIIGGDDERRMREAWDDLVRIARMIREADNNGGLESDYVGPLLNAMGRTIYRITGDDCTMASPHRIDDGRDDIGLYPTTTLE